MVQAQWMLIGLLSIGLVITLIVQGWECKSTPNGFNVVLQVMFFVVLWLAWAFSLILPSLTQ